MDGVGNTNNQGDPGRSPAIAQLIDQVRASRAAGDSLDDASIISAHPQLMPELGHELDKLRRIEAAWAATADGSPTAAAGESPAPVGPAEMELAKALAADLERPSIEVPGYTVLREIGRGGQAVVFLAFKLNPGRRVALKVMRDGSLADDRALARFKLEAGILADLNHPNIVTIFETGLTADGSHYLAMNYIAGCGLDEYMLSRQKTDADPSKLLRLFFRICDIVNAAHVKQIVHRDLKPGNIRIDERGEPHILDFGLARPALDRTAAAAGGSAPVSVTGEFLGSLPWSSPEQAAGDHRNIDVRTDVYSLGVILYQMLTGGRFPYEVVGNIRDVLNNIVTSQPTPPSKVVAAPSTALGTGRPAKDSDGPRRLAPRLRSGQAAKHPPAVNEAIEKIVLKALSKQPDQRYQNAGELGRAIADYLLGRKAPAAGRGKTQKRPRRRLVAMTAIAATLIGGILWQRLPQEDSPMKPSHLIKSLVLLLTTGAFGGPKPAPPDNQPPAQARLAVPDAAAQSKKEKLIRDVFGNFNAAPLADRPAIAAKLLEQGMATADDPAARYVMLKDSGELAASAGDAATAMRAATLLSSIYAVDPGDLKLALLRKAASAATTPVVAAAVAQEGVNCANEAAVSGNYDLANRFMTPTEQAARTAKDVTLILSVQSRAADIKWLQSESFHAKTAEEKLNKTPTDPDANHTLGRFFCLVRGDWTRGLIGLSKGSNPAYHAAAVADLANPTTTDKQVAAGDLWWDIAEKETSGAAQRALRRRAGYWYSQAVANPQFAGLSRALVEKRLGQIPPVGPGEAVAEVPGQAAPPAVQPPAAGAIALPVAGATYVWNGGLSVTFRRDGRVFAGDRDAGTWAIDGDAVEIHWDDETQKPPRKTMERLEIVENGQALLSHTHGKHPRQNPPFVPPSDASTPTDTSPNAVTNTLGMKLVRIEPGEFMMGSPATEAGRNDNEILHHVKISRPFLMATTTVTQAQWKAIMGRNPSGSQGDDRPVDEVSWHDAVAFCEKLSAKEGKHYRLPTEAEWEYACRAGTQTPFSFGDGNIDDFAWYQANSQAQIHNVATKKPNRWGLFDMQGNVWQWCSDWYGVYDGNGIDPKGAEESRFRVMRGGSFQNTPASCRAACRHQFPPDERGGHIGFRVCLDTAELPGVVESPPAVRSAAIFLTELPERSVHSGGNVRLFKGKTAYGHDAVVNGFNATQAIGLNPSFGSVSTIDYALDGKFLAFRAGVGILDAAKAPPTLRFSVKADGKSVWDSKPVFQGQPIQKCEISVTGVRDLQLLVWCSGDNKEGMAVWIDPQLLPATSPPSPEPSATTFAPLTNSIGMKLVPIPAGEFLMGSPPTEGGRYENETLHHVKITKPFLMATTTVTQAQWKAVMGNDPAKSKGDNLPVEQVSWEDANEFCKGLSTKEAKHYRLPTEAEWEYACRAGTQTPFSFGDGRIEDFAWYKINSGDQSHDVATKKPNNWGLYDMTGNVWQWCSDAYGLYGGDATDPKGASDAPTRVARGGAWNSFPFRSRCASRVGNPPNLRSAYFGFRVCLDTAQPAGAAATPGPANVPPAGGSIFTDAPPRPDASANPFTNTLGMKLVPIPAGEFMMGSPKDEKHRQPGPEDETLHHVTITKPFLIATTTVTQAQWKSLMGSNPSYYRAAPEGTTTPRLLTFAGREDNLPVEQTSLNDAVKFCEKLSAKEGRHYRLPTEAEWEYACRAGTQTAFGDGSLDDIAWYAANSGKVTHEVAMKKPNRWGLYDMIGNVWQWCSDGYAPYAGDAVDPQGSNDRSFCVNRGGSCVFDPANCRAAMRRKFNPGNRNSDVGFRVCLDTAGLPALGSSLDLTTVQPTAVQVGFATLGVNQAPAFVDHLPKLNGEPAARYFFAHAPSKITFAAGSFAGKTFVAKGVVTHPGTHGVIFIVQADGKEIFRSKLARQDEVIDIEARLPADAKALELIADPDGVSTSAWAFWTYPTITNGAVADAGASAHPAVQPPAASVDTNHIAGTWVNTRRSDRYVLNDDRTGGILSSNGEFWTKFNWTFEKDTLTFISVRKDWRLVTVFDKGLGKPGKATWTANGSAEDRGTIGRLAQLVADAAPVVGQWKNTRTSGDAGNERYVFNSDLTGEIPMPNGEIWFRFTWTFDGTTLTIISFKNDWRIVTVFDQGLGSPGKISGTTNGHTKDRGTMVRDTAPAPAPVLPPAFVPPGGNVSAGASPAVPVGTTAPANTPPAGGNIFTDDSAAARKNILLFVGDSKEEAFFKVIPGANVRVVKREEKGATLARPDAVGEAQIVVWGLNTLVALQGDAAAPATWERLRQFVDAGGDLVIFEQGIGTPEALRGVSNNMEKHFGVKQHGGACYPVTVTAPDLATKAAAAGLDADYVEKAVFYTSYDLPAGAVPLIRAGKNQDRTVVAVLRSGKGRLILCGTNLDPRTEALDKVLFQYLYGASGAGATATPANVPPPDGNIFTDGPAPAVAAGLTAQLNDPAHWTVQKGTWHNAPNKLRGEGESEIWSDVPLPRNVVLTFRMNVIEGSDPRMDFYHANLSFTNIGKSQNLFPVLGPSAKLTTPPDGYIGTTRVGIAYVNNQPRLMTFKFGSDNFAVEIDGKPTYAGTYAPAADIRLQFHGGGKSGGVTEFSDFKVESLATSPAAPAATSSKPAAPGATSDPAAKPPASGINGSIFGDQDIKKQ